MTRSPRRPPATDKPPAARRPAALAPSAPAGSEPAPGASAALLHPRNRHQGRYDFALLTRDSPALAAFVVSNPYGEPSIDFARPAAVRALNRALLKTFYGIEHWDIPEGYLCPPIPGRVDYLHYLADLLAQSNGGAIPRGPAVRVLDIGVGANAIYPLLGHAEYGWRFLGSDTDGAALSCAQANIQSNGGLDQAIELRRQKSPDRIFQGLLAAGERFDLSLCNPPFHASAHEAQSASQRKWRGLGKAQPRHKAPLLNFGGQGAELWCEGGEAFFLRRMVEESVTVQDQVFWFSSLVSKESSLPEVFRSLRKARALDVRTVEMAQGQKKSRFVAWTFLDAAAQRAWRGR
ncbi:23S rRNA (adenine(1618)-N(6))-methyltransferase RlmF [Pollutimonas bauzanensis]|uniref:Ribosomal RNA large subunit methyltransferase F n=1 Tax=Pollutimonas bauzanensis TaxID=658167 RepID=A0A1M5SPD7_9BURK|nr:23S rRNA (adenine(1618)-N(6))-methyltransferase RlmF [Pollutimonas bauzanensis]SHH40419.1 23S rRNA (adenine1618-N6)-methyltransferase [Pollutimonas bauzanensis]